MNPASGKVVNGQVRGGQQPIGGASVQLYAVGTTGDGSAATPLLTRPVVTGQDGTFSLTGLYQCPSAATPVYLTATGGNPGLSVGTVNPQIALMTVVGPCGGLTPDSQLSLNELTTVVSAFVLAPYMHSIAAVGSASGDAAGLAAAFNEATVIFDAGTGTAPGGGVPAGYAVPVAMINTLADLLEACVNSPGGAAGDGSTCGTLFSNAMVGQTTAPSDTVGAALGIALHPAVNQAPLFSLMSPASTFLPALSAAPAVWSVNPVVDVAAPSIAPAGTFSSTQTVTLSDPTPGVTIFYTTDGTAPTAASSVYTVPLTVAATTTIQAVAAVGTAMSSVSAATVTIQTPVVPTLVFLSSPSGGVAGATLTPVVQVAAEDGSGHVVSSQSGTVTISLGNNGAGAVLGGTTSAALTNGVASFGSLSVGSAANGLTLVATAPGFTDGVSPAFNVAAAASLPLVAAKSADSFVNSVGLNVHFSYYGSIYTDQSAAMIADIGRLGVRHLRDQMAWEGTNVSASPFYAIHNRLGPMGIGTDYILTSLTYPDSQVAAYPSLVNDMEAAEPANEADASGDVNWAADVTAQAAGLYATVHGSTPIPGVTVLAPSLAQPANAPQLGNVSATSDAGNLHPYFSGWNPGNSGTNGANNPAYFMNLARVNNPTQPIWVTETGYWSTPGAYAGGYGVDEATQAIYLPRTLLEFWNAGASRSYIYELVDWTAGQSFGLLRGDGSAKPAFGAVENLLTLLGDPGASFTPGSLAYKLTGGDLLVQQALFQKADGSFYLAIWVEAQSYDFIHQQAIAVTPQLVSLQIGRTVTAATSYELDAAGKMTPTVLAAAQTIPLTVTDKLQVVRVVVQ